MIFLGSWRTWLIAEEGGEDASRGVEGGGARGLARGISERIGVVEEEMEGLIVEEGGEGMAGVMAVEAEGEKIWEGLGGREGGRE